MDIRPFASIGEPPQHVGVKRRPSGLEIDRNAATPAANTTVGHYAFKICAMPTGRSFSTHMVTAEADEQPALRSLEGIYRRAPLAAPAMHIHPVAASTRADKNISLVRVHLFVGPILCAFLNSEWPFSRL